VRLKGKCVSDADNEQSAGASERCNTHSLHNGCIEAASLAVIIPSSSECIQLNARQ
jgi:hypothetical protein